MKSLTDEELMQLIQESIIDSTSLETDYLAIISELVFRINEHYNVHNNLNNPPEKLQSLMDVFGKLDQKIYSQYMIFTTFIKYLQHAKDGTLPSIEEALAATGLSKKDIAEFKKEFETQKPITDNQQDTQNKATNIPKTNCFNTRGPIN